MRSIGLQAHNSAIMQMSAAGKKNLVEDFIMYPMNVFSMLFFYDAVTLGDLDLPVKLAVLAGPVQLDVTFRDR